MERPPPRPPLFRALSGQGPSGLREPARRVNPATGAGHGHARSRFLCTCACARFSMMVEAPRAAPPAASPGRPP
eukprot:1892805-Pyramimonas_sp.AAC.1